MKPLFGQTASLWMHTATYPSFPALETAQTVDVCVIGGGIAGVSIAYLLSLEGHSVMVIDAGAIGVSGETPRTTAHLSNAIDDRYTKVERYHGLEGARLAAASHTAAIDRIERIVHDEEIDCDFARVNGYLFLAPEHKIRILDNERNAARRAGLSEVRLTFQDSLGSFPLGPALCFPDQAQLNVAPFVLGMLETIQARSGRIFAETRVTEVAGGNSVRIRTSQGIEVTAGAVVVATNSPINDRMVMQTKIAAYRSYVIAMPVPRGLVRPALYWDTAEPYHYVRLTGSASEHDDAELLIVGGEDHKTGQAQDATTRWSRLESWTRERIPSVGKVKHRWSGQIMETIDALGFIGRNPLDADNVYIVTGDSGHGIIQGTIAAMLISDLIVGRPNPWEKLYDPARKTLTAAGQFTRENLNVAAQYADYLLRESAESPDAVACGEGDVIRQGLKRIAVYRDAKGTLHECSAVCPHLGCVVNWNPAEHTWDCPCHGSRFSALGEVINGPAVGALAPVVLERHCEIATQEAMCHD